MWTIAIKYYLPTTQHSMLATEIQHIKIIFYNKILTNLKNGSKQTNYH